jgi:hypothetical protein
MLVVLCAALLPACTSHYMVRDPATGTEYYTTEVDDAGKAGAVRFTDDRTGSEVTLPSSEVKPVSEERYRQGLYTPR